MEPELQKCLTFVWVLGIIPASLYWLKKSGNGQGLMQKVQIDSRTCTRFFGKGWSRQAQLLINSSWQSAKRGMAVGVSHNFLTLTENAKRLFYFQVLGLIPITLHMLANKLTKSVVNLQVCQI